MYLNLLNLSQERVKIFPLFSGNCLINYRLRIFWWKKKDIGRAMGIITQCHKTWFKEFFFKFYFKKVNVFMFFNFEPNFIEKLFWKEVFQILISWLFSLKENSFVCLFVCLLFFF